jgi:hypothetical protein
MIAKYGKLQSGQKQLQNKLKDMNKKIKARYSDVSVDENFYGTLKINNPSDIKVLTDEEFKEGKQGYIYAPFVLGEHTEESLKQYNEFMREYHKQHECCHRCGSKNHSTTLVGYILNWDKKEDYKDMNRCCCAECGDVHSAHDRVPSA